MSNQQPDERIKHTTPSRTPRSGGGSSQCPPSPSLSASKVEEIIAVLWTILWAVLWTNNASPYVLYLVGAKAAMDHFLSIKLAIYENREEGEVESRAESGPEKEPDRLKAACASFIEAWKEMHAAEDLLDKEVQPRLDACKTKQDRMNLIDGLPKEYQGVRKIYEAADKSSASEEAE